MSAHTPGPWTVIGKQGYAVWCGNEILTSAMRGNTISPATAHANARLIAAAPELLSLLQAWVAGCGDEHFSTKQECRELIQRSGNVIAKALGK